MLWKESYRINVKQIDDEHRVLCDHVERMVQMVQMVQPGGPQPGKKEMQDMTSFAINNLLLHFRGEEKYQRAIEYEGYEDHKKVHDAFTETLLEYEKKLKESDYNILVVKEFVGLLFSWLVNHINEYDMRIGNSVKDIRGKESTQKYSKRELNNMVHDSCKEAIGMTFKELYNARVVGYKKRDSIKSMRGDFFCIQQIEVQSVGKYEFIVGYRNDFALKLINQLTVTPRQFSRIDEMVISSMCELTDIITTRVGVLMEDNHTPCVISPVTWMSGTYPERVENGQHEIIYLEVVTNLGSYDTMIYH